MHHSTDIVLILGIESFASFLRLNLLLMVHVEYSLLAVVINLYGIQYVSDPRGEFPGDRFGTSSYIR